MSTQLKLSAGLSTLAMAALALVMHIGANEGGGSGSPRPATAHGSIVSVLLGA